MIYLAFFKSLITTIKPIFFRFFSIIKYLILALLAILLYMLVNRVGAWHVGDISSIIELQYNDTGHNRGLEHIDYADIFLSRGDAKYINDTHKQNPLWYNYSYAKGYKVLYLSNSIYGVFVFKKGTFTHTLGYPYGTTGFASFEIPTNGFLGKITNIFSSKKFKNIKATGNGFIFYNLNNDDIEITSHVCGREFPGYYFDHTTRGYPLKIFDFKNKLLYEYDGVPNAKAGPNSGGCWILPYLDEEANRIYNFTYSKTQKHNSSPIFVGGIISNTYVYHTNENNRLFTDAYNELNSYKRFYIKGEQLATSKKPEQYQAEYEEKKEEYQNSPSYNMCQKDYQHYKTQAFGLQQCILSNTGSFDPYPAIKEDILNYYKGDFSTGSNIGISYHSYLLNGQSPFQFLDPNTVIGFCKIRIEKENQFFIDRVGGGTLRTVQYADILNKQLSSINTGSVFPNYISEDDYCSYNKKYIGTTNDGTYSGFLDKLTDKLVSFISSTGSQNNVPNFLSPIKKYFDTNFKIENKEIVPGLVNYCKQGNGYTVANILYILFLFSILFIIYKFTQ